MAHNPRAVVITGASAGVGRAVACEFARHGWSVGLVARGQAGLEAARAEVERLGGRAFVLPADVAEAKAVGTAADRFADRFGRINVWINAAMATVLSPVSDTTPEEFSRVTDVTYLGQVHGVMAALRHMRGEGQGTIVSIGSALAYRGIPLQAPYCAAKFATRGFLDALRTELLHEGSPVRVTEVHLPAVNTPQFDWARNKMPRRAMPVPPVFQPEAIAREVYRAALSAPREIWLGGSAAKAILGDAFAPRLVDRMLSTQGYSGQQTEDQARERPDNLFEPLDRERDFGARGRFDDIASDGVTAFNPVWLKVGAIAAVGALAAGGFALGAAWGRSSASPVQRPRA
ncbi:SDR family oxidoreductase [Rubellimicrobium roseum]|uniref:SDR family oxidoreductase n=1 Tax=Rubellimicrobium roseum TaxID=687525 RepID=A0A5C4N7Q2_9RHOB|nr:SDR family oxidoreductase [Rubellimicrobium roseum]TNC66817.1 SDR family oxidoreductase [Rubellimicrobium roseum]